MDRKTIVEALLFASQEPLAVLQIQTILKWGDREEILQLIKGLQEEYESLDRAFQIVEVAGGYQLRSRPDLAPWIRKLKKQRGASLTQASLETLAITAYKQPITRAEIEYIRGVDCGAVLRGLLEKGLLKILGRKDVPGRPLIYGTSKRFLEVFGLKNLSGLPDLSEIRELEAMQPAQDAVVSLAAANEEVEADP